MGTWWPGEVAHLAVTSMGTWRRNANCTHRVKVQVGPQTFACETWYSHRRICHKSQCWLSWVVLQALLYSWPLIWWCFKHSVRYYVGLICTQLSWCVFDLLESRSTSKTDTICSVSIYTVLQHGTEGSIGVRYWSTPPQNRLTYFFV